MGKLTVKSLLVAAKENDSSLENQCNALLYLIKKKEMAQYQLPLDYDQFVAAIEKACVDCFLAIHLKHLNQPLYGLGLLCHPTILCLTPVVNTKRSMDKYNSEDWVHHDTESAFFTDISQKLFSKLPSVSSEDEREYFTLSVFEACVAALENLTARHFFKQGSFVLFSVTGGVFNDYQTEWLKRLNPTQHQ